MRSILHASIPQHSMGKAINHLASSTTRSDSIEVFARASHRALTRTLREIKTHETHRRTRQCTRSTHAKRAPNEPKTACAQFLHALETRTLITLARMYSDCERVHAEQR